MANTDCVDTVSVDNLLRQSWYLGNVDSNDVYSVSPVESPAQTPASSRPASPLAMAMDIEGLQIPSPNCAPSASGSPAVYSVESSARKPAGISNDSDHSSKRGHSGRNKGPGRKAANLKRGRKSRKNKAAVEAKLKSGLGPTWLADVERRPSKFADADILDGEVDMTELPAAGSGYVGHSPELPPYQSPWLGDIVGSKTKYSLKVVKAMKTG